MSPGCRHARVGYSCALCASRAVAVVPPQFAADQPLSLLISRIVGLAGWRIVDVHTIRIRQVTTRPPDYPPTRLRYFVAFFLPAIARFGPRRVRALVRVRWPRVGRPRRWRRPR